LIARQSRQSPLHKMPFWHYLYVWLLHCLWGLAMAGPAFGQVICVGLGQVIGCQRQEEGK
jgi:hypothetical protein